MRAPVFSSIAVRARRAAIGLAETVEDVGQKSRRDAVAGVDHIHAHLRPIRLHADLDAPAARREFHRVREKVPEHVLEAIGKLHPERVAAVQKRLALFVEEKHGAADAFFGGRGDILPSEGRLADAGWPENQSACSHRHAVVQQRINLFQAALECLFRQRASRESPVPTG